MSHFFVFGLTILVANRVESIDIESIVDLNRAVICYAAGGLNIIHTIGRFIISGIEPEILNPDGYVNLSGT